jgi:hypothetical protein
MKSTKQLGIWMDHSVAHQMELTNGVIVINTFESVPKSGDAEQTMPKDEEFRLKKQQNQFYSFLKKSFYSALPMPLMAY